MKKTVPKVVPPSDVADGPLNSKVEFINTVFKSWAVDVVTGRSRRPMAMNKSAAGVREPSLLSMCLVVLPSHCRAKDKVRQHSERGVISSLSRGFVSGKANMSGWGFDDH